MSTMALNFNSKNGLCGLVGTMKGGSRNRAIAYGLPSSMHYVL